MKIRQAQIQTFEKVRTPEFENFMVEHLRTFTPLHSKSLGVAGIREFIKQGMARAEKHGFSDRAPVKFYIETCVLLGIDFDTDPQYPRLGEILRGKDPSGQVEKADAAHKWLIDFLEAAGGPDREFAREALSRSRNIPYPYQRTSNFQEDAIRMMRATHPQKADFLGDAVLVALLRRAFEEAKQCGIAREDGVALFTGLMFAVGHGVLRDPKYPWVAHTLTNPAIAPEHRVERLYNKTMTYLDHVLQSLGKK
jgi:hypothetical protein